MYLEIILSGCFSSWLFCKYIACSFTRIYLIIFDCNKHLGKETKNWNSFLKFATVLTTFIFKSLILVSMFILNTYFEPAYQPISMFILLPYRLMCRGDDAVFPRACCLVLGGASPPYSGDPLLLRFLKQWVWWVQFAFLNLTITEVLSIGSANGLALNRQ